MIGSISWLLLEKLLRVASGVLVSTAVARHLGPEGYGVLAVAIGGIAVATAAANMGADHVNLAELARADTPDFLASAFPVRLLWAALCAGAAGLMVLRSDASAGPLYLALAGSVLAAAPLVFTHQLYADSRFAVASAIGIASVLVGATVRLLGVSFDLGVEWFAWCLTIEAAALALGVTLAATWSGRWQPMRGSTQEALRYLKLCGPTLASAVLVAAYLRLELFFVGGFLGSEAAGTWAAAMMFILPWNMASAAILPVVNRRLTKLSPDDGSRERAMVQLLRAMLVLGLICMVVNIVAIHGVVSLLLGARYAASIEIATIGSVALLPLFLGAVQDVWLAQRRRTSVVLRKVLVGLPLSLGLLALGASQAGLVGVAIGMCLSYFLTAVLLNAWLDADFFGLQLTAIGARRARRH